jgi:catechol 2,3-dioxygenase-like lactoylglutathione lyase family enzyme
VSELVEVALFSDDIEAAKAFYRELLGTAPESDWSGGAIFSAGRAKLLVHESGAAQEHGPPNDDHFALSVADLEAVFDHLRAQGLAFLVAPHDYPWGRSAYLRDPDGRLVELTQA